MRFNEEYLFRQIADESVFIPISGEAAKQSKLIAVNETAAQIVGFIRDGADLPQVVAQMQSLYPDVPECELRQDVSETINSLIDCGILVSD